MTRYTQADTGSAFGRRPFLKGVGATLVGTALFSGQAAAHPQFPPQNPNANTTFGEGVSVVGDDHPDLWTFATTNERSGKPMMMGLWMTRAGFDAVTGGESAHYHLDLPAVDGVHFTYAGVDWNEGGHPPAPLWTVPHFDFHFYLMDEAAVEDIPLGIAAYDFPEGAVPTGYVTEDELGAPLRTIIPEMGEHLADASAFSPPYTLIYGAYDPAIDPDDPSDVLMLPFGPGGELVPVPVYEGDGEGELTFVEPMVTAEFLSSLLVDGGEVRADIPTPEGFPEAGYYPTAYTVRYYGREDAFVVSLEDFEWFDALDA